MDWSSSPACFPFLCLRHGCYCSSKRWTLPLGEDAPILTIPGLVASSPCPSFSWGGDCWLSSFDFVLCCGFFWHFPVKGTHKIFLHWVSRSLELTDTSDAPMHFGVINQEVIMHMRRSLTFFLAEVYESAPPFLCIGKSPQYAD